MMMRIYHYLNSITLGLELGAKPQHPGVQKQCAKKKKVHYLLHQIGSRRAAAALLAEIGHRMELLSLLFLLSLRLISDRRVEQKKL